MAHPGDLPPHNSRSSQADLNGTSYTTRRMMATAAISGQLDQYESSSQGNTQDRHTGTVHFDSSHTPSPESSMQSRMQPINRTGSYRASATRH